MRMMAAATSVLQLCIQSLRLPPASALDIECERGLSLKHIRGLTGHLSANYYELVLTKEQ